MTGFRGSDDSGRVVDDLTPETLRMLLITAEGSVTVDDLRSGLWSRARRLDAEAWEIHIAGDQAVVTTAANTDAAFDILRSWAAGDDWWREAFDWAVAPGP